MPEEIKLRCDSNESGRFLEDLSGILFSIFFPVCLQLSRDAIKATEFMTTI